MVTTRASRSILAAAILAAMLSGCEIQTTDRWLPHPLGDSTAASAAAADTADAAPRLVPPVVLLWQRYSGQALAAGVALDAQRVWMPLAVDDTDALSVGSELAAAVAVTRASTTPLYSVLNVSRDGSWIVPERTLDVAVGDVLLRVDGADGSGREPVHVIALRGGMILTTCPRSAAGPVFTAAGAWLPAVWLPDPQGACAVLKPLPLDAF